MEVYNTSNTLEQLLFKLEKIIGMYKFARKVKIVMLFNRQKREKICIGLNKIGEMKTITNWSYYAHILHGESGVDDL